MGQSVDIKPDNVQVAAFVGQLRYLSECKAGVKVPGLNYMAPTFVVGDALYKASRNPLTPVIWNEAKVAIGNADVVSVAKATAAGAKVVAEHLPKELVVEEVRDLGLSLGVATAGVKCMTAAVPVLSSPPVQAAVLSTGPFAPFIEGGLILGAGLGCGYAALKASNVVKDYTNPMLVPKLPSVVPSALRQ